MGKNFSRHEQRMRLELTQLAAKIIAEEGVADYKVAKRKAAERLGVEHAKYLPKNQEIHQAVAEYQRLFHPDTQPKILHQMRLTALEALSFFEKFNPRICGAIIDGTIDSNQPISIHLFSDSSTEVALFLLNHNIPHESKERRIRIAIDNVQSYPVFQFIANDFTVELVVMPENGIRQAPLSPVDGKPTKRLNYNAAQRLFTGDPTD